MGGRSSAEGGHHRQRAATWLATEGASLVLMRWSFLAEGGEVCVAYHQKRPNSIIQKNDGGGHEHGETDKLVKLSTSRRIWLAKGELRHEGASENGGGAIKRSKGSPFLLCKEGIATTVSGNKGVFF